MTARVLFGSFNVWGIDPRHAVAEFLEQALAHIGPRTAGLVGVGFQEVWFQSQLDSVLERWTKGGTRPRAYTRVTSHVSVADPAWKCLVPRVPAAGIPGIKQLELSSGLALCVRGTVKDAFFTRFRGGYSPDRFSNKGVLAALLDSGETRPYAILTTHFHDYSNDAFGGARRNNLQALASVVRWIDENWAVPIVVTGDFNIDARQAHEQEPSIETVLYKELVILRKPPGHWWLDVNATVNAPMPKRTQREGERAIDYILLSEPKLASQLSFDCASCGSDHQLVTSSWISA